MLGLHVKRIYTAGIDAVKPAQLVKQALQFDTSTNVLHVNDTGNQYQLDRNVLLVGFGKAVLGMTAAVHSLLHAHIKQGIISIPVESIKTHTKDIQPLLGDARIKLVEGAAGNLPDFTAEKTAQDILSLVTNATADDFIIALISGGGSALLPLPVEGISLNDKRKTIELLSAAGATINQLNIVRQSLSQVKGGKLAAHAYPAKILGLILSDIIKDPLEYIASGPTIPQSSNHHAACDILLKKYPHLSFPSSVIKYVSSESSLLNSITTNDSSSVHNVLIGNNKMAVSAAADEAKRWGYDVIIWSHDLQGEARDIGCFYAKLTNMILLLTRQEMKSEIILEKLKNFLSSVLVSEKDLLKLANEIDAIYSNKIDAINSNRLCIISGGETTVTLKGNGRGGRNQELALSFAKEIHNLQDKEIEREKNGQEYKKENSSFIFASVGTDGQDGPTDAAGAMADANTWTEALKQERIEPNYALDNNDSYSLLSLLCDGEYHIKTGLTGTNVMDIHILLINN